MRQFCEIAGLTVSVYAVLKGAKLGPFFVLKFSSNVCPRRAYADTPKRRTPIRPNAERNC